jgi:hypothetical protein
MQGEARGVGGLWLIAVSVISFFVSSSVVGLLLQRAGLADKDIVDAKYRQAVADPGVNLIFLGASLVDMGFNPVEFDAAMRMRGLCSSSYNLGIGGLTIPEVLALLKRLQASSHVRYILLAPSFWLLDVGRYPNSIRSIDYFNLPNALIFAAYVASFRKMPSAVEQKEYWSNIAIATFRHYTNIGLVRLLLVTAPTKYYYEYNFWEAYQRQAHLKGQARSDQSFHSAEELKIYEALLERFATERARMLASEPTSVGRFEEYLTNELFDYFTRALAIARTITPNVVAVEPPNVVYAEFDLSFVARLRSSIAQEPPFLDFSDPIEYSELFEPQNRYDSSHLNASGAVVWSRLLADRSAMIKSGVVEAPSLNACAT